MENLDIYSLLYIESDGVRMKIRVLLVTGHQQTKTFLTDMLEPDKELEIVAQADNAFMARDYIISHKPDVMLLCNDIHRMPGIVFLERLIPQYDIPTVFLAEEYLKERAYDAGAKDFIPYDIEDREVFEKLSFERIGKRIKKTFFPNLDVYSENAHKKAIKDYSKKIIAMGASTGGTEAICKVIKELKADLPGIVMVQHMPEGFTQMYAERLNRECELAVKEARTGDIVRDGQVLLAPGDKHIKLVRVNGVYQVECRKGLKVSGHCPSVDVLFHSVAREAGKDAIGVLMTGMGRDGADGLLAMRKAGAVTIGQDEKSSVVYGMPKAAYDIGAVTYQVPLEQIADKIYYIFKKQKGVSV